MDQLKLEGKILEILKENLTLEKESDKLWNEAHPDLAIDLLKDKPEEEQLEFILLGALLEQQKAIKKSISLRKKIYETKK